MQNKGNTNVTIDKLLNELERLEQSQLQDQKSKIEQDIRDSCEGDLSKGKLLSVFQKKIASEPPDLKNLLRDAWNKAASLDDKLKMVVEALAFFEKMPTQKTSLFMNSSKSILKTDANLLSFLKDPQDYLSKNRELSAHDAQILQFLANDPSFRDLPSLRSIRTTNKEAMTALSRHMQSLCDSGLKNYGSLDAVRFSQCINPDCRVQVLDNLTKSNPGPEKGFAGAHREYTHDLIAATANQLKKMGAGACHQFAQLAANHLMQAQAARQLSDVSIKMVSHEAGLGSHTFLLVGHDSDDLTDLSKCVIVDAWAVSMGYQDTYGVYTLENYPYSEMVNNLKCVYDSSAPNQTATKSDEGTMNRSVKAAISGGMFTKPVAARGLLKEPQSQAIIFLLSLEDYADKGLNAARPREKISLLAKKNLMAQLAEAVVNKTIAPDEAMNLGALAIHSFVEQRGEAFEWEKITNVSEPLLTIFNQNLEYWKKFAKDSLSKPGVETLEDSLVNEIVSKLDGIKENHFFNPIKPKSTPTR